MNLIELNKINREMEEPLKRLTADRALGSYKSINSAINAVYRKNAKWINARVIDDYMPAQKLFKEFVKDHLDDGLTLKQAIDETYKNLRTGKEISQANMLTAIKKDPDMYKELRKQTGWNLKVSPANLHFVKKDGNTTHWEYKTPKGVFHFSLSKREAEDESRTIKYLWRMTKKVLNIPGKSKGIAV